MTKLRTLIIEDELDHSETVVNILKNKALSHLTNLGEIDFLQAHNINQAASNISQQKPDLAIVDIRLGSNLEAVLKFIESTRKIHPNCLFLMVTAFPGQTTSERATQTGAAYLLIKPYDPELLSKTVFTLLESAALTKQR